MRDGGMVMGRANFNKCKGNITLRHPDGRLRLPVRVWLSEPHLAG